MIDKYVKNLMAEHSIPGVSVGVVRDGNPVLMKGYGLANVELSVPVTEQSVYELASISKPFTATATMMLVEEKAISLDDSITDYLPDSPAAWKPVTLRHILSHQSGIPSYTSVADYWKTTRQDISKHEIIALVAELPLMFAPGDRWSYDNTGYYLLGFMLEKVSGKPYEEFLHERIFAPLEMNATVMNNPAAIIKNRVSGYRLENKILYNKEYYSPSGTYAAGGWLSSIADMVKWEAAMCTKKLLNQSTWEQMWMPYETTYGNEREKYGFTQGLGWHLPNYTKRKVLSHNGAIKGFSTNMSRFVDDKITVIFLCNLEGIQRPDIFTKAIAEHFVPALAQESLKPPI